MKKHTDIFTIMLLLAKQKSIIIWITVIVAICAISYSIITPKIWTSKATFRPDASSSMSLPIDVSGLGGIMSSFLGGGSESAQNALIVLRSRSFNERAIRELKLIDYFEISEPDTLIQMDIALKKLHSDVLAIGLNDENGLISLSISTKDKMLSKNMADYYLAELDRYNRESKLTKGKRNRQFFESRVAAVRKDIDSLTIAMRDFQKLNKAIDITAQTSSLVTLYSEIVSQKMIVDMELDMAKQNYSVESPVVKNLVQRQKMMTDRIRDLEKNSSKIKPNYIIDIDNIPDLSQQYAQLMINLQIQKKIFEFIYPQFEAAKIEELKDMPTIEIVDYPRQAGLRSSPRRAMICVVATFLGFIFSLVLAFVIDQIEQNHIIVKQILDAIFRRRSSSKIQK